MNIVENPGETYTLGIKEKYPNNFSLNLFGGYRRV